MIDQGIPLTAFAVDDLQKEHERMTGLGVVFRTAPTQMGPTTVAVFEDTCGNLISRGDARGWPSWKPAAPT